MAYISIFLSDCVRPITKTYQMHLYFDIYLCATWKKHHTKFSHFSPPKKHYTRYLNTHFLQWLIWATLFQPSDFFYDIGIRVQDTYTRRQCNILGTWIHAGAGAVTQSDNMITHVLTHLPVLWQEDFPTGGKALPAGILVWRAKCTLCNSPLSNWLGSECF